MDLTLGCTTRPYKELPFAEACRRIAAAGYTDVALFRNALDPLAGREEALTARETARDAGLNPSMLLARATLELGMDKAVRNYRRVIENAAALGANWVLDVGAGERSRRDEYVSLMREMAPYAAQAGVQITLKPHGGITLSTDDLIDIHRLVDHPAFGICYDPGNIIYYSRGQERPEMNIARVAPLVTTAIIKDCVVRDGKPDVMITPGEGWVDFEQVLAALIEGGFRGPLYVECVGGDTIEEIDRNVNNTYRFLRDILARL